MESKQHDIVIVGAGISGLSAAHYLKKFDAELDVVLLEKSERAGGVVQSFFQDGYLAEWGPHGFLDNCSESRELIADLGLASEVIKAPLKKFVRYLCLKGRLIQVPQSPLHMMLSAILPLSAKFRVLGEFWKKPFPEESTVADWVEHRFGPAILPLVDAALTGTHAGDLNRLSMDAIMPGLRRLEKEHGSVIKGVLKKRKEKTSSGLPSMTNFKSGMEGMIRALTLDKSVTYKTEVQSLSREESGWKIQTQNFSLMAKQVVLALPVNQALPLLIPFSAPPCPRIREARIVNVLMGFEDTARIPFGFGYLAPESEKRFALGAFFTTHVFPDRAPKNKKLIEVLVGGSRHPERLELDDKTLIEKSYLDLCELIPLPKRPHFSHVLRSKGGIPQLELGHSRLQTWRDNLEKMEPGLHVCGFGWDAIGFNEMITKSKAVALAAIQNRSEKKDTIEVKGVYF